MDKYKDLSEIISEMLIKQDQTTDAIKKLGEKVDVLTEQIHITNDRLEATNNILQNFMEVSVKQWEEQAKFNERLYDKLDKFERLFEKFVALEDRIKHLENLESRVAKLERLLNAG